jgi:phosphoribosylanthranilate isomerase
MTWVKICGLTTIEDAQCAAEAGAGALGFVFADSPRRVEVEAARVMLEACDPRPVGVGVFVNASPAEIERTLRATGCTVAQLHGAEEAHYLARLWPHGVIKALRVGSGISEHWLEPYREAQAILLDTFVHGRPGGTGKRFDHQLAGELVARGWRIIIAGGLTPENVAEVVRTVRPYGVDVSTGVESSPGRKDHGKMRAFMAAVRAAEAE